MKNSILILVLATLLFSCSSEDDNASTPIESPVLTTTAITNISQTSATSGGNITSDGGGNVTARGVVFSTTQNPTTADAITSEGSGTGNFTSNLTGLTPATTYFVRAYATNSGGTAYGNELSFTSAAEIERPVLTTTAITNISQAIATSGGNITSDGGGNVTARGVVFSTTQNPTTADAITNDGSGTGNFTSNLTELTSVATYFVRAYATNSAGTAYGNELSFTSAAIIGEVSNPTTGKTWMDRNLGASQVATSSTDEASYGDLYQWGRGSDGHQLRTSETTPTLSSTDQPGNGNFIIAPTSPFDWRSSQNVNLWQGVNGINNPCPSGYRLPTEAELNEERTSWSSNNAAGAFASPLKLPVAGIRNTNGSLNVVGVAGNYWSSTVTGDFSRNLYFDSSNAFMNTSRRADGFSVRCLKD